MADCFSLYAGMMKLRKPLFTCLLLWGIFSCNTKEGKAPTSSQIVRDSLPGVDTVADNAHTAFTDLDNGLFQVEPESYKVTFQTKAPYKSDSIAFDVMATLDNTEHGEINALRIYYQGEEHELKHLEYPIFRARELKAFQQHPNVLFRDYNFDDYPDVAIHNREASGMKNQVYDVYLYTPDKKRYLKNRFLSENVNMMLDAKEQALTSFYAGGMASQIYNSSTYKWLNGEYIMVRSEQQNYIDSLDRYIRITKHLQDTTWITKTDTLRDEELNR